MTPRKWLISLQILGVLSLPIYPGVLLANIMSLGAPPASNPGLLDSLIKALLWVMMGYPLMWIVLWWLSWRVLARGRTILAFGFSTPPALFAVALGVALFGSSLYSAWMMREYEESRVDVGRAVSAESPLAAALLRYEDGSLDWQFVQEAIARASADELQKPVTIPLPQIPGVEVTTFVAVPLEPRSPLAIAIRGSGLERSFDMGTVNVKLLEAAQLLSKRGATLSADEQQTEVSLVWLADIVARGIRLPDPRARDENPLVVRIIEATGANEAEVSNLIYEYRRTQPELLMRPTTTYGTPLKAALIRNATHHLESLLYNGALLSAAEREQPSVAHALEQFLASPVNTSLRERYEDSLRKAATASPPVAR